MDRKITLRIALAVAVLAVLSAGGWFGFLAWSRAKVRAEVDAAFAALRERGSRASFTDASFDPKDLAVTVTGISIASQDGAARVSVERLSARGGERPVDRRVAIEALDLDGVEVTLTGDAAGGGAATWHLPQVMIDRYNGPMTLVAAGEGSGPFGALRVALRQLAATTAAKVTIPEARGRITPPDAGPVEEITYRNIAAEGVNAGAIRSLLVDATTFSVAARAAQGDTPAAGRIEGRVDGLVAAQVDTAPLLAITQPGGPAGRAAETYGRVLGKLVTGPYAMKQEDGVAQGGSVLLMENVAIKPAAFDVRRIADLDALSRKAPDLSPEETRRLTQLSRDVIAGLSLGAVAITNATSEQPGDRGRIAALRLEGLANGVLDAMTLEGVEASTPDGGTARLARFGIRQLDFNALAQLGAEADPPSIASALGLFRLFAGIELKGLEVPYGEGADHNEPVTVGALSLSWGGSLGALPSYLDFTLTDASGPIRPEDGAPFSYLVGAGVKRATLSLGLKAAYDISAQTLSLAPVTAEVKDAFRVTLESTLDEVPEAAFKEPAGFAAALPRIAAGPMKVTLTDLGLARLMYPQLAAAAGMSADDYRAGIAALVENVAADLAETAPDAVKVGAALAAFVRDPGTLTLTATPRGRVPLLALAASPDPAVLLEAFRLEATATAP